MGVLTYPSLVVILAALNEEQGIGPSLAELRLVLEKPRCLVVDGKSVDRTIEVAKEMGAEVLLQEGIGKGEAISQAIRYINSDAVDYVVLTDADYTYPIECVPEMIRILEQNPEVGMVVGNRFNSHLHLGAMKNYFYLGNRVIAFTNNLLNGINLRDPLTGLRVIRWKIIKNWQPKSSGFDIEVELNHHVERQGYDIREIEIAYRKRIGEKKLKLRHGVTILKRILTESILK